MVEVREKPCGKELVDNRMKRGPGYSAGGTSSSSADRITASTRGLKESVSFLPLGEVASSQGFAVLLFPQETLYFSPQQIRWE